VFLLCIEKILHYALLSKHSIEEKDFLDRLSQEKNTTTTNQELQAGNAATAVLCKAGFTQRESDARGCLTRQLIHPTVYMIRI